jgi:phosphoribosylformylglycinamidine (FGAM) synthase-like enzyme
MCFKNKLGADLDFSEYYNKDLRRDEFLFSESVGRFIIETDPQHYEKIMELAKKFNITAKKIGVLIPNPEIFIDGLEIEKIKLDVMKMKKLYDSTIPNLMEI